MQIFPLFLSRVKLRGLSIFKKKPAKRDVEGGITTRKYQITETLADTSSVGKVGEELARTFYLESGYTIVDSNVHKRFGEIDVITKKGGHYVFCEVKTRTSDLFGEAVESLTSTKRKRLWRIVQYYALKHKIAPENFQVDFIAIQIYGSTADLKHFANIEL